ncbi:hypothetical protein Bcell_3807 [Evansella cellulosilytica DSM 2522]|uniref:Uncharacterized protein n=1 Tax=Evansella cellulosilytica (strain ATCC 21833 / DSM 2522 / FERM P-1141 / JCM 9156 / N-4) TaxID=649639 RepID=E6TU16_EVAC2|nr:hypothetical protein Bcell_3807 [Evansella cellulosilytica DSM 2522]
MSILQKILFIITIYGISLALILVLLWYFDPSLNGVVRTLIISLPILISTVLVQLIERKTNLRKK